MIRGVVRPAALRDLLEARDHYAERRPILGAQFVSEVERTLVQILSRPRSFGVFRGRKRRALVHRFPYAVFFRDDGDVIVILAVWHTARLPRGWQRRS